MASEREPEHHELGFSPERGDRLSQLIESLGGLSEAAAIADATEDRLTHWQQGAERWEFWGIARLCHAAGRPIGWLLYGAPEVIDREAIAAAVFDESVFVIDLAIQLEGFESTRAAKAIQERVLQRLKLDRQGGDG